MAYNLRHKALQAHLEDISNGIEKPRSVEDYERLFYEVIHEHWEAKSFEALKDRSTKSSPSNSPKINEFDQLIVDEIEREHEVALIEARNNAYSAE